MPWEKTTNSLRSMGRAEGQHGILCATLMSPSAPTQTLLNLGIRGTGHVARADLGLYAFQVED